jgi:hypothetical protein
MAFSLLGGAASGSSTSSGTQSASIEFDPTVINSGGEQMSPYPVGQGLSTVNTALPGSAALPTATDPVSTVAASLGISSTTLLLLALAVGAYFFLRK